MCSVLATCGLVLQFVFEYFEFLCNTVFIDTPSTQCDWSSSIEVQSSFDVYLFLALSVRGNNHCGDAPHPKKPCGHADRRTEMHEIVRRAMVFKGSY